MYQHKTKIVATIGPATESEAQLEKAIKAGLNVVRFNFSHGDMAEHETKLLRARKIAQKMDVPLAVLQDLSGPKIRTGEFKTDTVILKAGQTFILTTKACVGDETRVFVNYPKLTSEVEIGGIIYLDDGKKKLEITKITDDEVVCRVLVGGETKGRRGVNMPGAKLSISSLTTKDKQDVEFGIKYDVEYVAISFVRQASHVLELRKLLDKRGKQHIKIIAKVETQGAIDNIDEILAAADGIMVARGDLAMEVPAEQVPIIQKELILKCNKVGKPVITATQMLESMINSPVPTRAEVNDVANAVFDGTDAVMLSEETTLGKYPLEAIETMSRVASYTEQHICHHDVLEREHLEKKTTTDSVSYAALNMAHEIQASAIVALSSSGFTARMIARHRPHVPVIVLTQDKLVYNQLSLSYGCYPLVTKRFDSVLGVTDEAKKILLSRKLVKKGDCVIITAGLPLSAPGNTNLVLAYNI